MIPATQEALVTMSSLLPIFIIMVCPGKSIWFTFSNLMSITIVMIHTTEKARTTFSNLMSICIIVVHAAKKAWFYKRSPIASINPKSAGSQSTLYNLSFVSHLAASCSFRTRSPDFILHIKQSMDKWKFG